MARIAKAALLASRKTYSDTFCGIFCRQVWPVDTSDADARRAQLTESTHWLRSLFGTEEDAPEWNTQKKYWRNDPPTAKSGAKKGCNRNATF